MEPSVLSTLKTCTIEGCKKYAHANGFCRQHYDEERKSFRVARAAMGEAKEPQARGGRRDIIRLVARSSSTQTDFRKAKAATHMAVAAPSTSTAMPAMRLMSGSKS